MTGGVVSDAPSSAERFDRVRHPRCGARCNLGAPAPVLAQITDPTVTDPTGDFLCGCTGARDGDMDVIGTSGTSGTYDTAAQTFTIVAAMNGAVGVTSTAAYVWGVNTGSGPATLGGSLGLTGAVFNKTIAITPRGTINLAGRTATVNGAMLAQVLPLSALPAAMNGFTAADYS